MKTAEDLHPDDDPPERAPRLNPDLFGHPEAEASFLSAWNSGRMPHAWLLAGPRGIGKATLAYRMARFVLADGGQGGGLFGAPDSLAMAPGDRVFQRVGALGHSDLRVIRRSKNKTGKWRQDISIEDVRDMGAFLRLTAGEGAWRVAIIDSADEMTRQAANAALKVVEEPPPRALILLVSHAPGRLLPTIRSRCRRLVLRPLDDTLVKRIVAKHHPTLPADELDALARLAEGSAGRALALVDHGGVELHRAMLAMLQGFPRVDGLALDRLSDRLGRAGAEEGFRVFGEMLTNLLSRLCRDQKAGRLAGGPSEAPSQDPEAPVAQALAAAAGLDRWLQVWEKLAELFARAESAKLDRKQVVVDAVLTLAQAARNRT